MNYPEPRYSFNQWRWARWRDTEDNEFFYNLQNINIITYRAKSTRKKYSQWLDLHDEGFLWHSTDPDYGNGGKD